jgi:hypothetical protein
MSDHFTTEAAAFIIQYDRLKLDERRSYSDLPPKPDTRVVLGMAEKFRVQRTNPFRNFSPWDIHALDLADAFLKWAADFTNPNAWRAVFEARVELDD